MFLDLHSATGGLSFDEIAAGIALSSDYNQPMCRPLEFNAPVRVVIMGASIMNGAFSSSQNRDEFISTAAEQGLVVSSITEYATGGHRSSDTLSVVPTVLSDYSGVESETVVIIHTGGNDISGNGPYPGGADALNTNLRTIISDLTAAGFTVIPSSITYRIPPSSNPSAPYNEQIVIPAITELTPHALRLSGRPVIDLYRYTMVTNDLHHSDGIHYTADGSIAIARYVAESLADVIKTVDLATADFVDDVIIDFGSNFTSSDFGFVPAAGGSNPVTADIFRNSAGVILNDLSVTTSGFADSHNTSGIDHGGLGYSLSRAELTRDSLYVAHPAFSANNGQIGLIEFSGSSLEDSQLYTVEIVASRNASDNLRWGLYEIDGQSQELNASDDGSSGVPKILFENISGAQLKSSGIQVTRRDTDLDSFAYVGAVRIARV